MPDLCVCGEYQINDFGVCCNACQVDQERFRRAMVRRRLPEVEAMVGLAGGWGRALDARIGSACEEGAPETVVEDETTPLPRETNAQVAGAWVAGVIR
jgi:hypothetical protein